MLSLSLPSSLLGLVLYAAPTIIGLVIVELFVLGVRNPPGIPLIREKPRARWFSLRTKLAYFSESEVIFKEAWHKYLKHGKPVVLPGIGTRNEVILPKKSMRWTLAQPEETLSVWHAFIDLDQTNYSLGHDKYASDQWQALLVASQLNPILGKLALILSDETSVAIDTELGTDTENWKDVDVMDFSRAVIAQASSRFIVGLPLCRNREYNQESAHIANQIVMTGAVTTLLPRILRPVSRVFTVWHMTNRVNKLKKWVRPLYQSQLKALASQDKGQTVEGDEPRSQLQMMLEYAQKHRPEELFDEDTMVRRLCMANLGAMHQTLFSASKAILDIVGSDAEYNTIAVLRDEFDRVLGDNLDDDQIWTKANVARLVRTDSVIRETMRLGSFAGRAGFRKVMVDNFQTDEGYHVPKGSMISFMGRESQRDEEVYEDPLKYDPFRFSRVRESKMDEGRTEPLGPAGATFVTTSPEYLPFGHGKHSCPGRFLVDYELKMFIVFLLSRYDLDFPPAYNGKRPPDAWVAEALYGPPGAKIRVRRRASTVYA